MTPYDRFTCYTSKKRGGLLRKTLGLRMGPAKVVIVGERGWGSASCIMNRGRGMKAMSRDAVRSLIFAVSARWRYIYRGVLVSTDRHYSSYLTCVS